MLLFGERLRKMRKANKMTQQQLADVVGLTKASISCYESDTRTPTLETMIDLANALNVELIYLLGVDGYLVANDDIQYGINISRDEIRLIRTLRRYPQLYNMMLKDPKRMAELIDKKVR